MTTDEEVLDYITRHKVSRRGLQACFGTGRATLAIRRLKDAGLIQTVSDGNGKYHYEASGVVATLARPAEIG